MASKLIQLYSDEAATQKAYPICHEKGVFDSEGNESITAIKTALGNKVDKVTGKGLSTNDYTTDEKNKLGNIEARANKTIVDSALSSTSTNPVQNKIIKGVLDTHQTNILYALETGAANYAPLEGDSKTGSGYFLNATSKGMNVIPSGTTVHIYCEYTKITNTQFSIQLTNVNGDVIASTTSYAPSAPTSGTVSVDVTPNVDAYGYNANYNGASGNTCTITKVMICPKNVWDAIQKYVPYSAPNYDLTRMVSELQKKAVKVYTYHVNPNESDPEDAVTYLDDASGLTPAKMGASSFSYGSWANAWFLPRPCVLKFDGTVDYYLNPNDYSKKTDGTASTIDSSNSTGNVMLEFPKIWVKRVNDGNGARTVSIAPVNVDGTYKCWSNINAEDKEVDHFYLPAYNGTIHSSKMRSLSGVTLNTTYAPNYTRAQEVIAATANNPTGKNLWYTETWADFCLIYDLLYLMGKSLDVQRTFGQGLSSGSETAMRAYVTGTHNAKGLFYGDVSGTSTAVKVLGMENLWGCRWHSVAGLINDNGTLKVKMTYGVADGSTTVGYNTTGSGYLNCGSTYSTNGYVKKMQADNTMGYKIIETAGTDATYYCDYYYTNNSQSNYALLGGRSGADAYCGFCVDLYNGAASAYWTIGGSLSCRP